MTAYLLAVLAVWLMFEMGAHVARAAVVVAHKVRTMSRASTRMHHAGTMAIT
jgi:hypothetical protein